MAACRAGTGEGAEGEWLALLGGGETDGSRGGGGKAGLLRLVRERAPPSRPLSLLWVQLGAASGRPRPNRVTGQGRNSLGHPFRGLTLVCSLGSGASCARSSSAPGQPREQAGVSLWWAAGSHFSLRGSSPCWAHGRRSVHADFS